MAKNSSFLIIGLIIVAIIVGVYWYAAGETEVKSGPVIQTQEPGQPAVVPDTMPDKTENAEPETVDPVIDEPDTTEEVLDTEEPEIETDETMVYIRQTRLDPVELTVDAGTTVTWVNEGVGVHQLHHIAVQRLFTSDRIMPGDSFSFTFNEPGIYRYGGVIHPGMMGKIIVLGENEITGSVIGAFSNSQFSALFTLAIIVFILSLSYMIHKN